MKIVLMVTLAWCVLMTGWNVLLIGRLNEAEARIDQIEEDLNDAGLILDD